MEIKGNIGDEVYIKAKIRGVSISETEGVVYLVTAHDGDDFVPVTENEIRFKAQKTIEIKSDLVVENPKYSHKEMKKENEKTDTFGYSAWLDDAIKQTGLSKAVFCSKINAWLDEEQAFGRHTGLGHFYPADLTNYINGRKNMSTRKIETIADFNKDYFAKSKEHKTENDMIATGKAKRATVESTMAKLEKMRGVK